MKKLFTAVFTFFILCNTYSQTRTAYVLIKEQKGNNWSCPSQQVAFKVHQLNSLMSYDKKQKALAVFKERLKGGDDNARIKDYSVTMKQNDYLVFYEYKYRYSEKADPKCEANTRTIIKGFPISNIEEIQEKLDRKLAINLYKDRYISHKVLEIQQPFVTKDASYLDKFNKYMRKKYPNSKQKKSTAIGVRG